MKQKFIRNLILITISMTFITSCGAANYGTVQSGIGVGTASIYEMAPAAASLYSRIIKFIQSKILGQNKDPDEYKSPIDFEKLQKKNPDVYAWIEIPDTDIAYPVLNRAGDDSYYLIHNIDNKLDAKGAIYTEDYNSLTFDDPVTVVYGHTTKSGVMFGSLQKNYSNAEYFEAHRKLMIYLPDREIEYSIFAAVPYSDIHILYNYDFTRERVYNAFFSDILSTRSLDAVIDDTVKPDAGAGDDILILSTCFNGDSTKRYLILAKKITNAVEPIKY